MTGPSPAADHPERHVVLVSPEVHWNTGNIGRTCLGVGATLHLIEPLGFSLDAREVRRAGLDYWPRVDLRVWKDFPSFLAATEPGPGEVALFAKQGPKSFRSMPSPRRLFLIFGSETRGLATEIQERFPEARYHIPVSREIRCLNLSTAAAVALYESLRGWPVDHGWEEGPRPNGPRK